MLRRITLSSSTYKLIKNKQQLEAQNLKIKIIDQLSNNISKRIKSLKLAYNAIARLDNIKQFVYLEDIDLRFNAIRDGKQILVLKELNKLSRLFIDGNPFLLEPLDEDVMEFLVQKQTDIQILSGETLNNIKELEEGQLKVVFLQNYLKKMNCHDEIIARRLGRTQTLKKSPQKQQATNKLIIDKIMPQFYTIIDDPKIKTKLKKQALQLKKQQQISFDQAMKKKNQQQQSKVNNLIKDILLLVQQRSQMHQHSSIQKSSPKKQDWDTMPKEKPKNSQVKSIMKDQMQDYSDAFRRKLMRIKNNGNKNINYQYNQQSERNTLKEKKIFLDTDVINFDNTLSSRSKNFVFSPMQKQKKRNTLSPNNLNMSSQQNFYSFNKTTPMPFSINQEDQIKKKKKNNQVKYQTKKKIQPKPQIKQHQFLDDYIFQSTRRDQIKQQVNPNTSRQEFGTAPHVQSELYEQYYTYLTKYNPSFALLYSQISTLSHEQKSVLIQALAKDHKNKTVQLFLQRTKVKNLKQTAIDNANFHQKQKAFLNQQLSQLKQNYQLSRKYAIQLQKQNSRLGQLIKVVTQDIMDAKEQSNKYKKINKQKNQKIQVLQFKLKQKEQEMEYNDRCQDFAEIIKQNANTRIRKQYLKLIKDRASQNLRIIKWKQKKQKKDNIKLLNISWSLLKKHLLVHVLAKMKSTQRQTNLLKLVFQAWKQDAKYQKINQQKIKKIRNKIILKDYLNNFRLSFSSKKTYQKQRNLKKFWADHHFLKSIFFKLKKKVKISQKESEINSQKYFSFYKQLLKNKIFKKIKQAAILTKNKTIKIEQKFRNNNKKLFYYKLRKLFIEKLLDQQKNHKIKSIKRILKFQLQDKRKKQAIKSLKTQNQQLKVFSKSVILFLKQKNFKKLRLNIKQSNQNKQNIQKADHLRKLLIWRRFCNSHKKYKLLILKIQQFFIRTKKNANKADVLLERRTNLVQNRLKVNKIRVAFINLFRNSYENKIFDIRVRQRMQQQQTQQLLSKMKALEQMEVQAIKSQHQNYVNILQQKDIRKQVQYRNQLMKIQNGKQELEDTVKILKKQVTELKQRENLFFKQKQLIQQQIRMVEEGKASLNQLNQNLRIELGSLNAKYQRMLELYTQAMIQIQKKDKQTQYPPIQQKQKQRQKTVEKQKRQIGVVKNNSQIPVQRNRIH